MPSFILFHVYLILMITSITTSIRSLIRHNSDMIAVMTVLFFMSLIGLSCNYAGWIRVFCGMYGIVLLG
jgi:hypothetical protein